MRSAHFFPIVKTELTRHTHTRFKVSAFFWRAVLALTAHDSIWQPLLNSFSSRCRIRFAFERSSFCMVGIGVYCPKRCRGTWHQGDCCLEHCTEESSEPGKCFSRIDVMVCACCPVKRDANHADQIANSCGFVRSFWIRRVERDLRLFGQKLKFWIHSTAFALRRPLWKCKFSKPLDRRNSTIYILKILSSRHIIDGRLAILDFILFRLCSYPGWWHLERYWYVIS